MKGRITLARCPLTRCPLTRRAGLGRPMRNGMALVMGLPMMFGALAGCSGSVPDDTPDTNLPPVITQLSASQLTLAPGESTQLSVQATDPELQPLRYRWEASNGTFEPNNAQEVRWMAVDAGTFLLRCSVADDVGAESSVDVTVTVVLPELDGDGDGWTVDQGDCNNADSSTYPTALEAADGRDNDCDGAIDEGSGLDDQDQDGVTPFEGDCDDLDPKIHPGVSDPPDGVDNDCDGIIDEGSTTNDDDLDGFSELDGDCDDLRGDVYPGALELPDATDNDCDTVVDEETSLFDDDGDGYSEQAGDCNDDDSSIAPATPEVPDGKDQDCDALIDEDTPQQDLDGDGISLSEQDCNDQDATVYPKALELPDGVDNDCDGRVDEGTTVSDDDKDGLSEAEGDCDDNDVSVYPGAIEYLDAKDNDCDGAIDEGSSGIDDDGDGLSEDEGDCDDLNLRRSPERPEVPDGLDNDCDGEVDEATMSADADLDGYSPSTGDCDDADPSVYPGAVDVPEDGVRNDCLNVPIAQAPVAVAQVAGATPGCTALLLDSAGSYDYEGMGLVYQWYVLEGPSGSLESPALLEPADGAETRFEWSVEGIYRVALAVSDGTLTGAEALLTLDTDQLRGDICGRDDDGDGYSTSDGDCNDSDLNINPTAIEVCDGIDQNCDGKEILFDETFDNADPDRWTVSGTALFQEGEVLLTAAERNQTGSVFYSTLLPLKRFTVTYEFLMEGGSSGNGLTLALLAPETPSFLGEGGGGNGVLGLPGYGLEFDTNNDSVYDTVTSTDHIALVRTDDLAALATYPRTNSRSSPMVAELRVDDGILTVVWNSVQVLSVPSTWTLPTEGYLGFAATTAYDTDRHHLTRVSFECR